MKTRIKLLTILTFAIAIFVFACTKNESSNSTQIVNKQIYKSIGVIKKVDAENSKITIDHEEISGYMSAMEMNESVSDKKLLENLKIGDKVDFEIERTGEKIVITKISKIGETALINSSEIYKTNCSECHGANGEGAKKGIPLISGHALAHTEDEYIKQVTDGKDKKMPAFKDKLSNEQITAIVKFVREELQKDVKPEQREHHHH